MTPMADRAGLTALYRSGDGTGAQCRSRASAMTIEAARDDGDRRAEARRITMTEAERFTIDDATNIGKAIGIDWSSSKFDIEQFLMGLHVELEHGRQDPATNVTDDDPIMTGKIALAHLNEYADYYTRLAKMEAEAELAAGG
jgi:hypothetical protein